MHIMLLMSIMIYFNLICVYIYSLLGVLGSGEFGTVNKGSWESPLGAMGVAVKQLQPGASDKEKVKFLQEAAISGQFRHPNVVKLMGVVTTGETVSYITFILERRGERGERGEGGEGGGRGRERGRGGVERES